MCVYVGGGRCGVGVGGERGGGGGLPGWPLLQKRRQ